MDSVDADAGLKMRLLPTNGDKMPPKTLVSRMHAFLNPRADGAVDTTEERLGLWFENCILLLILANVATFIAASDPTVGEASRGSFYKFDVATVVIFTVELALRVWSAPGAATRRLSVGDHGGSHGGGRRAQQELSAWGWRLNYLMSFYGFVDLASTVPFYISLATGAWSQTAMLRVFRIGRLLRGPDADEARRMLRQVLRDKADVLLVTFYAAVTFWVVFATLMYLAERGDHINTPNGMAQSDRYGTIPNAMWYTLIHLTGDFPLVDYTWEGKIVLMFIILAAVAVVCLPAGIYADGFTTLMRRRARQQRREQRRHRRQQSESKANHRNSSTVYGSLPLLNAPKAPNAPKVPAPLLYFFWHSYLSLGFLHPCAQMHFLTLTFILFFSNLFRPASVLQSAFDQPVSAVSPASGPGSLNRDSNEAEVTLRFRAFRFLWAETDSGQIFEVFILCVIGVSVISYVLSTVPTFKASPGYKPFDVFDAVEVVAVAIFTVELAARLWCCVEAPRFAGWSPWRARLSFLGSFLTIIDCLAVLPFYADLAIAGDAIENTSAIRIFRLVRLFKGEHYVAAFSLFDQVWTQNKYILMYTGLLALILWLTMGSLFWLAERDNDAMEGAFDTVANSLFMVAIFMGGEWARCDFTLWGKLLGVVMCWIVINLFAIPIGILSSGFEAVATQQQMAKRRVAKLKEAAERKRTPAMESVETGSSSKR